MLIKREDCERFESARSESTFDPVCMIIISLEKLVNVMFQEDRVILHAIPKHGS